MDGLIQLGPDDLTTAVGCSKLNNMFQALFNAMPGDGIKVISASGYGSPNGVVTAGIGSTYQQIDGSGATAFWTKQSGTGNTGWSSGTSYPLSQANGGTGTATGFPYIKVSNTQTQNTSGGSTTSGSWQTATINTKDNDTSSIGTLSANVLTLPAGTYQVAASMPIYNPQDRAQIRLFNSTASAVLINGSVIEGLTNQSNCYLMGEFTLGVQSNVVIQYQVTTSQATSGQGVLGNFGTEVYLIGEFLKVA